MIYLDRTHGRATGDHHQGGEFVRTPELLDYYHDHFVCSVSGLSILLKLRPIQPSPDIPLYHTILAVWILYLSSRSISRPAPL